MADLEIEVEDYDVKRVASVYSNTEGTRWWTKAWFNGREKGEIAVEVSRQMVIPALKGAITRDDWLTRFFPKQMSVCREAVEATRKQLMSMG